MPPPNSAFTIGTNGKSGDAQFRVSLHHRGTKEEADAFARMCEATVIEAEGVFGAFPKYDNGTYTFLLDFLPYVNGDGMEHRDSTVITATRDIHDSAAQLISTVSHEFFHYWNVKRIRPKSLQPFDYEQANMSGELWFAEGFTNYYGPLVLRRAGLWSLDRFTRTDGRRREPGDDRAGPAGPQRDRDEPPCAVCRCRDRQRSGELRQYLHLLLHLRTGAGARESISPFASTFRASRSTIG